MKNYFTTGEKSLCSGCAACQQACPFEALEMKSDEEGFIFPIKDKQKCTNCGLCERVCPFPKPDYSNKENPKVYATYLKEREERIKSTSGGIFYAIARYIINKGGIVYGAIIDPKFQVYHRGIESIEDLIQLRGSKYVQSETKDVFREIKIHLLNNRLVYYTGTGCQVAGLKAYLRKDYYNLITSDIICHGVPNQKLLDQHIEYLKKKIKGKITKIRFRDNINWGVKEIINIEINNKEKIIKHSSHIFSPYLYSFIEGYTYRYSCYICPFAHIPRQGDITLADFWGIGKIFPDMDYRCGVSMISINTEKGEEIWNKIKNVTTYQEADIKMGIKYNPNFSKPTEIPEIRKIIFKKINNEGYERVAMKYFKPKRAEIFKFYIKEIVRKGIGKKNIYKLKKWVR